MSILAVKSIPLSRETIDAWKSTGQITFLRRSRDGKIPRGIVPRYDCILNLGHTNLEVDTRGAIVYNAPDTIRSISTAPALRRTLGDHDLIPDYEFDGPHWHKLNGFAGAGKVFHEDIDTRLCHRMRGDVQRHVEGVEYRIITVGDMVVQAHRKEHDGNPLDGFGWEWIGVGAVRNGGFIPQVKQAVELIPQGDFSVLGFDVIHDGTRPWIIEINTSPGVNEATAERIVNAITRRET